MNKSELAEMISDYNNGNGLTNLELAKKYKITNSTVRRKLIEAGVYKAQRMEKNNPSSVRTAAWQLVMAEKVLHELIDWFEQEEGTIKDVYNQAKLYFKEK